YRQNEQHERAPVRRVGGGLFRCDRDGLILGGDYVTRRLRLGCRLLLLGGDSARRGGRRALSRLRLRRAAGGRCYFFGPPGGPFRQAAGERFRPWRPARASGLSAPCQPPRAPLSYYRVELGLRAGLR